MVQLVGFCVIAAIALIYFCVQYARGEISISLGEILKILIVTVIFTVGLLVIPVFSFIALGWIGLFFSIFSIIISFWISYKLLKHSN